MFPNPNPNPDPDPNQSDSGEQQVTLTTGPFPLSMGKLLEKIKTIVTFRTADASAQTIEVEPPDPIMYCVRPSRIAYPIFGRHPQRDYGGC